MIKRLEEKMAKEVDYLTDLQLASFSQRVPEVSKNYSCLLCNKVTLASEAALNEHLNSLVSFVSRSVENKQFR